MSTPKVALKHSLAFLCCTLMAASQLHAATYTWNNAGTGNWDGGLSDTTRWGTAQSIWNSTNGYSNEAVFNTASASGTVGLVYVNKITFSAAATLSSGTINFGGANPSVVDAAGATIKSVMSGADVTLESRVARLTLTGTNTFTGTLTLKSNVTGTSSAKRVQIQNANALGTATIDIGSSATDQIALEMYNSGGSMNGTFANAINLKTLGGSDGALRFNNGSKPTLTGTITLFADSVISVDASSAATATAPKFNGVITESGGVRNLRIANLNTSAGLFSGTAELNASNTFTGGLGIGRNTVVRIGNIGALNSASGSENAVDFDGSGSGTAHGGYLELNGNSVTVSKLTNSGISYAGTVWNNSATTAATLTVGNSQNLSGTFSGVLADGAAAGALSLTKAGSGTFTLTNANTYTGQTTINNGKISMGNALALQNSAYNTEGSNGTTIGLDVANGLSSGKLTLGGLAGSVNVGSAITNGYSSVSDLTLNPQSGITNTYSGVIANGASGMSLTKTGSGTQILTGANTYTGDTNINGGTLQIGNGGTTGKLSADSAITNNSALVFNRSDAIVQGTDFGSAAVSGTGSLTQAGSGMLTLMAANTYTGATTISSGTLQVGNGGTTGSLSSSAITNNSVLVFNRSNEVSQGAIGGTGSLNQNGAGTLTLNAANTYTGLTTINSGKIAMGHALALQNSAYNTAGSNGITIGLDVSGGLSSGKLTLGGLAGGVDLASAITAGYSSVSDLTLNPQAGASNTYSGVISNGASGMSLTKTGSGTQILAGANTFTGQTTISGGKIVLSHTLALQNSTFNTAGSNGTTIGLDVTNANALSSNILSLGGLAGSTNLASAIIGYSSVYGIVLNLQNGVTNTYGGVIANGTNVRNGTLTITGSGTQILTGANTSSGAITINSGGTLQIGNGGTTGKLATASNAAITINGALVFNRSDAIAQGTDFTSAVISGTGSIIQAGSGMVTFNNNNTFAGAVLINSGTLRIGDGGTKGTFNAGSVITNNGTLVINRSDAVNQQTHWTSSAISGAGSFIQAGSGTTTLNVANTFTGQTAVSNGKIAITNALALQNSAYNTVGSNGTTIGLDVSGGLNSNKLTLGGLAGGVDLGSAITAGYSSVSDLTLNPQSGISNTYSGAITNGTSSGMKLTKTGSGTQILTGANTYTGITTISSGTLQIGGGGNTGSLSTSSTITNNSALVFNRANDVAQGTDFSTAGIGGSGSLTQAGAGKLTLTGTNTYTGATTINGGILSISSTNGLAGTSGVNIAGGASLLYTGVADTFAKNITASSGTATVNNTGGLLTLSGTLTKNGTVLRLTGGSFNVTGKITGALDRSDLYVDGATVTLSNANNDYNGPTVVYNGGTLKNGANDAIPSSSSELVLGDSSNSNGTYDLNSWNQSLSKLSDAGNGSRIVTNSAAGGTSTLTITGSSSFGGSIRDGATAKIALTKTGADTLTLSGNNTYGGVTTVSGGKLVVSGSLGATLRVDVGTGATLASSGANNRIATTADSGNAVSIAGTLAPGDTGTIDTINFTLAGTAKMNFATGSTLSIDVGGNNSSDRVAFAVAGDWLSGSGNATLALNGTVDYNSTYTIFSNVTTAGFNFLNITGFDANAYTARFAQAGSNYELSFVAIPEPNTWAMLLGGLGMLMLGQRMRRVRK